MKTYPFALLLILGGLTAPASRAAEAAAPRKPNFIYLFTDDQRYDALGVVQREQGEKGRFPWLQTPNLDRLAGDGVRFRNAFVVNSLCAPSRATLLTGSYGHTNGVVNNHTPFPEHNVTCATVLRDAGYATGYVGKWHMGSQSGQRPGFTWSASFVGQGIYFDCPVEVNGKSTPTKGWIDDVSTDYAEEFIRREKDQPFLLILGFKTCHGPFTPPPRTAALYENEKARPVPNLATPAVYLNRPPAAEGTAPAAKPKGDGGLKDKLGMFRGITAIDENVGRIMKLLDELGLTGNTVVMFSSDNGYYLGEHGLGDKRTGYDESLRVPMLVRYPRLVTPGRTADQMVLNVDVAPTLIDLAGLPVPAQMHGRSWRPLLEGQPAPDWRSAFFYTYFFERGFNAPMVSAVRTETAKLLRYPGHDEWTEVFDLKSDPYETKNLFSDPGAAALREQLEAAYSRESAAISFKVPDFADDPAKAAPAGGKKQNKKPGATP